MEGVRGYREGEGPRSRPPLLSSPLGCPPLRRLLLPHRHPLPHRHHLQGIVLPDAYHGFTSPTPRMKIALDVARGLEYLHEHCNPPVIPINFKLSNILLDSDFNAKIGNWSRWLTDLFGMDADDTIRDGEDDVKDDDIRCEAGPKSFILLNQLSDLLVLPKN